jgi:hypothetical protein
MERVNIGDKVKNEDTAGGIISTSLHPIREELEAAWAILWAPFAEFPYVSVTDRAVVVAAVLTAVVRRTLAKAPAFCFVAPPACGKTLLATCIAELAGGDVAKASSKSVTEHWLISASMAGRTSIFFDDIQGSFRSDSLEAWLSDSHYTYREPHNLKASRVHTQMVVLIAGTTVIPGGDLDRRIVTAHLDPRVEHAERRNFSLDARKYCREHHHRLVGAALTLISGFIAAGSRRFSEDRLASFETWDDVVRQCVLWLNAEGIADLGDPVMEKRPSR